MEYKPHESWPHESRPHESRSHESQSHDVRPHDFWQEIRPAGGFADHVAAGLSNLYPARLPGGREIALPIRQLPAGDRALASLIVNQASFAVEDALAGAMAREAAAFAPALVVGVPTLGLPLAANVARRLGHPRMVALGTSRKFWYDDALSEPLHSITSPAEGKRIYLDPRMLPLLKGRAFVLVDDVVSTGSSILAVLRMLAKAGLRPDAIVVAMLQGETWRGALSSSAFGSIPVRSAIDTPLLARGPDGMWHPM
jgi:adenine/guanine phosphoribosyltransferase-like PRPP-binding protein